MRIVSLEPYITDLVISYGLAGSLVGVSERCKLPKDLPQPENVFLGASQTGPEKYYNEELSKSALNLSKLREVKPEIVIGSLYKNNFEASSREDVLKVQAALSVALGFDVKFISYAPRTLEEIYEGLRDLSKQLKVPQKGLESSGNIKAQLMDWGDNFYDRMKNKKVSFISGANPYSLAGFWLPDMIQLFSAHPQHFAAGARDKQTTWNEIVEFKPDVIVVAPRNYILKESMNLFKRLEQEPGWEDIPAVKRGEVIFADGSSTFYYPGNNIIDSAGVLVSAIAGLESGYITPRDSFYRLRWLELQRHKL